jgi:hypothetical protein
MFDKAFLYSPIIKIKIKVPNSREKTVSLDDAGTRLSYFELSFISQHSQFLLVYDLF